MVQSKLNLSGLKRYFLKCSKQELERDLSDLFTRYSVVKDYFQSNLEPEGGLQVLEKYKGIINNEFFPRRGFGRARWTIVKRAISDFKKVHTSPEQLVDLILFYVEAGVRFTKTYGDIDSEFYSNLEKMYAQAVELILKKERRDLFQDRCALIVRESANIGWGFSGAIEYIYEESFGS